jgi:pyruvate dehydrogenase E1 component alpha subunit
MFWTQNTSLLQKEDEGYRILDEHGQLVRDEVPDLSDEALIDFYRWMVFSRAFDQRCLKLQRQGRLGTYAPLSGQEAALIGSAYALEDRDWLFPTYREHGSLMLRGLPPENILIYWNGNEEGNRIPEGVNVFTVSIPIATQIIHAVGFTWAARIKGEDIAALVYVGDGGSSEGDFHEGLNFAGVFQTPTVIFCNNNQYAISLPRTGQTRSRTIAQKAVAYGIPGVQVDGNDPLAVYKVTREAIARAHEGKGPTLIEAVTYRYGPHTTADDPKRYRTDEELNTWLAKDPIVRMRNYLVNRSIWDNSMEEGLKTEVDEKIKEVVEKYENMPKRDPENMFKYLYAEMTPELRQQMEELRESMDREK